MQPLIGPVRLLHGTSLDEDTILREGLRVPDFSALIDRVAASYCIDPAGLRQALLQMGGVCDRENDKFVYLTGSWRHARSYAVAGGEFEGMILERVYEMCFGESEGGRGSPMMAWVVEQASVGPPVVVEVDVPEGVELLRDNAGGYQIPEVLPEWIVAVEPVVVCVCAHMDHCEPMCLPRCPPCEAGKCPGRESLRTGNPIEDHNEDERTDEEARNRQVATARERGKAERPQATYPEQ